MDLQFCTSGDLGCIFPVSLICLCVILMISLIAVCVVCLRQRRSISELEQQLVEVEKHVESNEQKVPIEGTDTITIKESPASQVWESDECVFYDLGSVSRGVSREVLDQIDTADEPPLVSENSNDSKENSSNQEHETNALEDETTVTDEKDLGIDEKGSVKSLPEDSKDQGGSLDELTDEIWVGDASKGSNEKLSINDALSDISENGGMEDSGNETISNDDVLCPNVDIDERGEDGNKSGSEDAVKEKELITAADGGEKEEKNVDESKA